MSTIYSRLSDYQHLKDAWNKVKANKPSAGIDHVTWEDFENNLKRELYLLNTELVNHSYEVGPVKIILMRQEEKMRPISLYSMRDKVVQASIAAELGKIYKDRLSNRSYAYRSDQSALLAVSEIEKAIQSEKYLFVLKTDISDFFENVLHDELKNILQKTIREEDVIELTFQQIRTPSMEKDGELTAKQVGLYQGSGISPFLSNIYLNDMDLEFEKKDLFYCRYADDIVILTNDKQKAEQALQRISFLLEEKGLHINESKTFLRSLEEGFNYLGYSFDTRGKSVPEKALKKMEQSLEDVWLTMSGSSLEERLKKGSRIMTGWEQYYRGERKISSIYEYTELVYMMRYKDELNMLRLLRSQFVNTYKDIALYLIEVWSERNWKELMLIEYEQYFQIQAQKDNHDGEGQTEGLHDVSQNEEMVGEILELFQSLMHCETPELWDELLQVYSDCNYYEEAERILEQRSKVGKREASMTVLVDSKTEEMTIFSTETYQLFEKVFVGRELPV